MRESSMNSFTLSSKPNPKNDSIQELEGTPVEPVIGPDPVRMPNRPLQSGMTKMRRRLSYALVFLAGGVLYFLLKVAFGEAPADAALSAAFFTITLAIAMAFVVRWQRRSLRRVAERGQFVCSIRRPEAPKGDGFRKWNYGLVTPTAGGLTFQPVLGTTTIHRGNPIRIGLRPSAGAARFAPSRWDKFNSLGPEVVILPLQAADGRVEVAGRTATLDRIQEALAGSESPDGGTN
ncbi:hypothetical protein I6N91_12055 [Arthrobacter sp. MSA 4-2]|uniref:hypothetical protein n=1 Tax=Arthrobacter sp. MSA 4-2 TaxID=2794349 RepID=UPI0018E6FC8C|nr:hypothetical protein [Arthrobacter sp. MSA 4-2]MBJ2121712.1 hypothetical protein [Arthrobacter sp. MSA 4-2]